MKTIVDILMERGFCKHVASDETGAVCMAVGANLAKHNDVMRYSDGFWEDMKKLGESARELFPERCTNSYVGYWSEDYVAIYFNNHVDTTYEDVILVAKHAGV